MIKLLPAAVSLLLALTVAPARGEEPMRLTLAEAQAMAVQNNPRLSEALLQAAASLQVPVQYRAILLPDLTGDATGVLADRGSRLAAGGLNNPVVYDRIAVGVTLAQILTDFGRTRNLIDMARLQADARYQVADQVRADLVLLAGQAFYALQREHAVLRVARETVAARKVLADQVTALAQSQLRSQLDVSFAVVNLGGANLFLVEAENAVRAGEAQLAAVLALPGDTRFILSEEAMPLPRKATLDQLVLQGLSDRPELKAARLEQEASEKFRAAEHALNYPHVALMGSAGVVPFVPSDRSQVRDRYGAIGINVNVPIFNGWLFTAREAEARLRAEAARQRVSDLQYQVARDVRIAGLSERTACERVPLSDELLKQAQTALDLADSRYRLGLSSIVELSQAQLNLTSAQIGAESAKYDCQAQHLNVDFQVGALR